MGVFGGGQMGATAPFPAVNYPAYSFFGPTSLQPKGATAENHISPKDRQQLTVVLLAVVGLGIGAFYVMHKR